MIIKKIGYEIWLIEDFLSEQECNHYIAAAEADSVESWNDAGGIQRKPDVCKGLRQKTLDALKIVVGPEEVDNKAFYDDNEGIVKYTTGAFMKLHHDNYRAEQIKAYMAANPDAPLIKHTGDLTYTCLVYLNTAEGGGIYYAKQNILHQPKRGDLIIHNSGLSECMHGVMKVQSEARYSYTGTLATEIDVPAFQFIPNYQDYYCKFFNDSDSILWDFHTDKVGTLPPSK